VLWKTGENINFFRGGTAGKQVTYNDALEVALNRASDRGTYSNVKVYYAKGTGPVALEFRENSQPTGTFKFYLGE